jgi:hypothetical protein
MDYGLIWKHRPASWPHLAIDKWDIETHVTYRFQLYCSSVGLYWFTFISFPSFQSQIYTF